MLIYPVATCWLMRSAPRSCGFRASRGAASNRCTNLTSISSKRISPTSSISAGGIFRHFSVSSDGEYWNRENSKAQNFDKNLPIVQEARIISLSNPQDAANDPVNDAAADPSKLPEGASLLSVGGSMDDFELNSLRQQDPNVIFVSHPMARTPLAQLLDALPSVQWVHARSAGIDFVASPTLANSSVLMTNAKGHFSSTLAEYTMMAVAYFAKDLPRLLQQHRDANWEQYPILEIRGTKLGIVGYGDIGQAAAKLAKVYGMKITALKRKRRGNSENGSDYCDKIYYSEENPQALNELMADNDYVLSSLPLTDQTRGMIGKEQFDHAKPNAVFINVGRGPVVDEEALIDALQSGRLKGAGLDVFSQEPLPKDSPLWKMKNVLLSPHNMDMTATFMREASEFFVEENLPRFLRGLPLLNEVDKAAGY